MLWLNKSCGSKGSACFSVRCVEILHKWRALLCPYRAVVQSSKRPATNDIVPNVYSQSPTEILRVIRVDMQVVIECDESHQSMYWHNVG